MKLDAFEVITMRAIGAGLFCFATFRRLGWWNIPAMIGILLMASGVAHAATLTPAETAAHLDRAMQAWDLRSARNIELRWEDLGACRMNGSDETATTQPYDVITTTTYDSDDPKVAPLAVTAHDYHYIIRMNSRCDWTRIDPEKVLEHELGHVIIGGSYHSKNKKSIMYPVITGSGQVVTYADRHARVKEEM